MDVNLRDIELSIVVPVFNEEENIGPLYKSLVSVLSGRYELIFVDDGSRDKSFDILHRFYEKDNRVKVIRMRKNFGQTAALDAGIKAASGSIIVTMDADGQNDPADIPFLLDELKKGYDVVSGWRYKRNDSFVRNILSYCANMLRKFLLGDVIHDSGCTLKAYKRECFDGLSFYGEMHRFIPAILSWKGYKIGELKVSHHPRRRGKSKYNLSRLVKGFLDLLVLRFWMRYSVRPIHLFGIIGIFLLMLGFFSGIYLSIVKFYFKIALAGRPMLFLTVLLFIIGVQFIVFGILADVMVQIYYGLNQRRAYSIKEILDNAAEKL